LPPPQHLFKANTACLLSTHNALSLLQPLSDSGQSSLYWQTTHIRRLP
jgi:hypothetical protein